MARQRRDSLGPGILDRIENRVEESGSARPFRKTLEGVLDEFPSGPLGKGGDGFVAGALGYAAINTGQLAVLPIPAVKQPGYSVISHGVEDMGEFERHDININAVSKTVARFAAAYEVASPSNIDYITGEVVIQDEELVTERSTYSTWNFQVDIADRGQKEV